MENIIVLNSGQKIEVLFQDEVSLDIDCSLRYIKSGQKEIQDYVENVSKKQLDSTIETALTTMDNQVRQCIEDASNAAKEAASETINNEMKEVESKIQDYVSGEIIPEIDSKASETALNADKALAASQSAAESAQNAAISAEAINIGNIVHTSGDETVEGTKTFVSSPLVPTADLSSNDNTTASTAFVTGKLSFAISTGSLMPFAGATAPNGWLVCDGSAISRTTYADLFAVIGTTYGTGDGATTFTLPNFVNRSFWGGTGAGAYLSQTLPNIKGYFGASDGSQADSKLFYVDGAISGASNMGGSSDNKISFNASRYSSIYKDSAGVRPNVVQTIICIKY